MTPKDCYNLFLVMVWLAFAGLMAHYHSGFFTIMFAFFAGFRLCMFTEVK